MNTIQQLRQRGTAHHTLVALCLIALLIGCEDEPRIDPGPVPDLSKYSDAQLYEAKQAIEETYDWEAYSQDYWDAWHAAYLPWFEAIEDEQWRHFTKRHESLKPGDHLSMEDADLSAWLIGRRRAVLPRVLLGEFTKSEGARWMQALPSKASFMNSEEVALFCSHELERSVTGRDNLRSSGLLLIETFARRTWISANVRPHLVPPGISAYDTCTKHDSVFEFGRKVELSREEEDKYVLIWDKGRTDGKPLDASQDNEWIDYAHINRQSLEITINRVWALWSEDAWDVGTESYQCDLVTDVWDAFVQAWTNAYLSTKECGEAQEKAITAEKLRQQEIEQKNKI